MREAHDQRCKSATGQSTRNEAGMSTNQNGAYISRRLPIRPGNASNVLAAWHRDLPRVAVAPWLVRFRAGLWISAGPNRKNIDPHQLDAIRGVLWFGLRPIRVVLEITEWSSRQCEASIRPSGLAWPVLTERYARRVGNLLDGIVGSLVDPHPRTAVASRGARVGAPRSAPDQSVA